MCVSLSTFKKMKRDNIEKISLQIVRVDRSSVKLFLQVCVCVHQLTQ